MNPEPIFTFDPGIYTRNLDIVGGYVTQMADYLHRVTGDNLDKTTSFIKANIKPGGLFPIQDPAITYLSKETRGNKQLYTPVMDDEPNKDYSRHDFTFLRYLNRIHTVGLIVAPTLTITFPPRFKKSLLALASPVITMFSGNCMALNANLKVSPCWMYTIACLPA